MANLAMRWKAHPVTGWAQAMSGVLILLMCGCATLKQVQYFEVVGDPDPNTGMAPKSYYRMTLEGHGGILVHYTMQGAYLSTAAIDTLNGKTAEIPVIDVPTDNQACFDVVKRAYLQNLANYACNRAGVPAVPLKPPPAKNEAEPAAQDPATHDPATQTPVAETPAAETPAAQTPVAQTLTAQDDVSIEIARQAWYASLSDSDLVSLGMIGSADPYRFRKLVFYTSAKNISLNLKDFGGQIDDVVAKTTQLAEAFKAKKEAEAEQRKQAEADKKARVQAFCTLISKLSGTELSLKDILPFFGSP